MKTLKRRSIRYSLKNNNWGTLALRCWIAVFGGLLIGALGAGCNNASQSGLAGSLGSPSSTDAQLADTGSDPGKAQSTSVFNPLAAPKTKAPGGREVIKNPTLQDVLAKGPVDEFVLGRADAPVTVIKYASLTCPYCRQFHEKEFPQLKRQLIDTGKIRFIIREFPIGRSSGNATIALRCAPMDKYLTLYGKFLSQQKNWVSQEVKLDRIFAVAQQVGMKQSQFDACLKNQGMIDGLQWVKDRGRKLGVIGTPNFFIQNKLYKKQLTTAEISQAVQQAQSAPALAASN